jgi:hypothetical protein
VKDSEGKVTDRTLKVVPKEAAFVKKVFSEYAKGKISYYAIAKMFEKEGSELLKEKTTRKDHLDWRYIKYMLENPLYISYQKFNDSKKGLIFYKHDFEPIISEELFFKVNPELKEKMDEDKRVYD